MVWVVIQINLPFIYTQLSVIYYEFLPKVFTPKIRILKQCNNLLKFWYIYTVYSK